MAPAERDVRLALRLLLAQLGLGVCAVGVVRADSELHFSRALGTPLAEMAGFALVASMVVVTVVSAAVGASGGLHMLRGRGSRRQATLGLGVALYQALLIATLLHAYVRAWKIQREWMERPTDCERFVGTAAKAEPGR